MSDSWVGLNSFMETHNWWHLALFLIEQDAHAAALDLYDRHVWGVCKPYSQDQIGAVSLLARLELAGVDVGDRWADVSAYLAVRTHDQVQPFLDMQYLYGLARAGLPEADALMRQVEAFARHAPELTRGAWQRVAVPACRGLLAHARGEHARAVDELGIALPRMLEIGGCSRPARPVRTGLHRCAGQVWAARRRAEPAAAARPCLPAIAALAAPARARP